jgi:multidrug efflux pump subunit AcrB
VDRWRELTGAIPDALELKFSASLFSTGDDVNVQLTGPNIDDLRAAADELKQRLAEYTGVYEISDSFVAGKRELKLNIKPAAEVAGLTLSDLARQVRQAFYGEEAQRIQRGRDEVKVMVRYPEDERRSLADVENMWIRTPDGLEVPFSEVATVELGRGFATIDRVDRRRAVNVTADVDPSRASAGDINADLRDNVLPEILLDYPGVYYSFEGAQAEQRDTISGLARGFLFALLVIYVLLAVPLRSYVQPLIIMAAIPFGLVGAIAGHFLLGLDLTILSMFGLVALTGVVVNDSLVMVDFINHHRKDAGDIESAVRQAGVARFRPILLTSLTTFAGLSPLMLERSMQARFLIPMAVSLAFGVVFATFITLVLVPSGYLIVEDLKRVVARLRGRRGSEATAEV